jgi:hypothetical protein
VNILQFINLNLPIYGRDFSVAVGLGAC